MIRDLRTLLDGWDYEPGKISVRKIIGRGGREKIQTRIDLGVLQLEPYGRPDGQRPKGCESLLEHHEKRLLSHFQARGSEDGFVLTPEDCRELRHEAYLYYQRYLSYFVLEDWDGVEQDTARNLRLLEFCREHAATENDRNALEAQRAYILMMNTRAKAYRSLQREAYDAAIVAIDRGIAAIRVNLPEDQQEPLPDTSSELGILLEMRREVLSKMPDDAPPRLQWELKQAVDAEDYETAARLRDRLAAQTRRAAAG